MKKVLFYCHVFYPQNSGYSNAFQNLVNLILDYVPDIHITVVTPFGLGNNTEIVRERLTIVRLKPKVNIRKIRYFLNDYFYAKEVSKLFKNGQYDLLFIETFDQALFINFLDNDMFIKTIVRAHSTNETEYTMFEKSIEYKVRKFIIKYLISKKIINIASTNRFHIEFVKKYYFNSNVIDIGNKNFFIIPNTVRNLNDIIDFEVRDKINLLILGRMDRLGFNQKGFLDFIYALRLLDNNILNRYQITVVGKGERKAHIQMLTKNLKNINFIDELTHEETLMYLKRSDLVVLPSRYEGLSMFALEALATGNALIFSRTGGLIDLVEDNGFFFEPQDIEGLADALTTMALKSDKEIMWMKKRSVDIFNRKFSPKIVAEKFNKILNLFIKE